MAGFHSQDRAGRGEEHRVVDEVRSSQIRCHTQVLYYTRRRSHRGDIVKGIAKVERAVRDRLVTERLDRRLLQYIWMRDEPRTSREGAHLEGGLMRCLVGLDLNELLDRDLGRDEASSNEVRLLELLQCLLVKLRLELLKDIRELWRRSRA